jgi:hypothetical protein
MLRVIMKRDSTIAVLMMKSKNIPEMRRLHVV